MTHWLDRLKQQAAAAPRRVMLPETADSRVTDAAATLLEQGLAVPVFESAPAVAVPGAEILNQQPDWPSQQQAIFDSIAEVLADKGEAAVVQAQQNPLMRAAVALRLGIVDTAVCGSLATTSEVLRAGIKGVGVSDAGLVSSSFILDWENRALSFADCAVVPDPDSQQLASIAVAAARTHEKLTGAVAKVAMLSFSTKGSGKHPLSEKVAEATTIVNQLAPELAVDGEIQFDAALLPDIAARKAPDSAVAGQANVYVFPDLNAANIGYKIAERMAGATATGPILNGLQKPWLDLSRGCSAADIVNLAVIGAVLSAERI